MDELVVNEDTTGTGCTVVGSSMAGDVRVSNVSLTMNSTVVGGNLRARGAETFLQDNHVQGGGNLAVGGNIIAVVTNNLLSGGGSLRVIDGLGGDCNQEAKVFVAGNLVLDGNVRVDCNRRAIVRQNSASGNIVCKDNIDLDAEPNNQSFGGTVNCSRGAF